LRRLSLLARVHIVIVFASDARRICQFAGFLSIEANMHGLGSKLTFLFWNLKRARLDLLTRLVKKNAVDILILAECPASPPSVLRALNQTTVSYFFASGKCPKIAIYTRFSEQYLLPHQAGSDFAIGRLVLPGRIEILLCAVHFPSKLRQSEIDQTQFATHFGTTVLARAEEEARHARTLLVGDLNMNPYENGVVVYNGLHAVMTREIAQKAPRLVNRIESNRFFYNPMWRHFGEQPEGHAGTYYYRSPKARADFWNVYDQVLLRPELLPYFRDKDLRILHGDAQLNLSLMRNRKPDGEMISDHLPILFRLSI
jgi:hypothetical protein